MVRLIGAAIAATMLTVATATAQVATPASLSPDRIAPAVTGMVADKVAKAKASTGYTRESFEQIQLAQMLRPDDRTVLYLVGRQSRSGGATERTYLDVLDFLPNEGVANFSIAELLAEEGYERLALPYYARAVEAYPGVNMYTYRGGLNAYFAGEYATCVKFLDLAIAGPVVLESGDMYIKRAECHAMLGHKAEAKADFEKAVEITPGNAYAYSTRMFRDGVYNGCRGTAASRAQSGYREWDRGSGSYGGYRELTIALQCDPNHLATLEVFLKIEQNDANLSRHAQMRRIRIADLKDGGQTSAARAAKLKPLSVAEMLAEADGIDMRAAGRPGRIRAVYLASRVLLTEPANMRARLLRARGLANLNVEALGPLSWDDATQAMRANPRDPVPYHIRAIWLERLNDKAGAASEYGMAIAAEPGNARYYVMRATVLGNDGKYAPALADLSAAIAREPGNRDAYIVRGNIQLAAGNPAAALPAYERAWQLDRNEPYPRIGMVRAHDAMGQTATADAIHLAILRDDRNQASDRFLAARNRPDLLAQVNREKDAAARAELADNAVSEFDRILRDWDPVVDCHAAHARVLANVGANGGPGDRARISDVNRPCYERAKALSIRANRFRSSRGYATLSQDRKSDMDKLLPMIDRAYNDLLKTRRIFGWNVD
ncbi:tetratricopeptide repeat protein [Sphingomonas sp. AOB5]|uniref:tetratricopeptide repeat protein n=1 Tax=Sphingomonas sp. AOB5 TaxID=3034017 RepID=UPI0023F8B760|nr:tetratricopeptide repeat protein [Sphingomonas sp. AOB5]MDF7776964.1 tetratricopeptide repeat protein [Sphingomonas sp. AOB5]